MVTMARPNAEILAELGGKFPKHIYHSIMCIGALIGHKENVA